jgi:hypothetical protein
MFIICKSQSKRLIKGNSYEVECLLNDGTNRAWLEGKVKVKDISGFFSVKSFTDTNGNEIPKLNIGSILQTPIESLKFEDLKVGDILICKTDKYKTLLNGGYYKIEKLETIQRTAYYKEKKVKLSGVNRVLKFCSWSFRKMTTQELRDANLDQLLHNKPVPVIDKPITRKFDHVDNKNKALLEILSKSILDPNRHKLDVIDWACVKSDSKLGVKKEDFSEILNLTLKEILECFN